MRATVDRAPATRRQTTAAGQDIWVSVVELVTRASKRDGPPPDRAEMTPALHHLWFRLASALQARPR